MGREEKKKRGFFRYKPPGGKRQDFESIFAPLTRETTSVDRCVVRRNTVGLLKGHIEENKREWVWR